MPRDVRLDPALPDPALPDSPQATSGLMSLAVGVVVVITLYVAREVLVPIALAILLAFVLEPVVRLLRRVRLGRVPASVLAVVIALGVILSLGGLIGTQITQLMTDLPRYATTIEQKIVGVRSLMVGQVNGAVARLGHQIQRASSEPVQPAARVAPEESVAEPPKPTLVEVRQPDPTPLEIAERLLSPVISPLLTTGIVFIVAIFILIQQADLRDRFIRLFGMQDLNRTTRALDDAARRLSRYFLTQLGLNAAFGVIIGFGLMLIGLPNPLLWGTLAALFRFIPYIGTLIASGLPIALAAAVEPGWGMAISTAALFLVSETIMGQFIDPLAYGRSTGLSPVSVVVATIFWTWMWGAIGLILAMPLTVCLVVLGRHVQRLEFLDVLMGDRPALTPVESFYQRILANDADEAQDYAETLLRDCSLSTYYDEVAVKGLQLVANDAERGALSKLQLAEIRSSMVHLVEELEEYDDVVPASAKARPSETSGMDQRDPALSSSQPPDPLSASPDQPTATGLEGAWAGASPVLCISGRGPLDDVVSGMLVQLLGKNGLTARAAPYAAASREEIASLDVTGVAMVCLSFLEIGERPSHQRYLVRRLRQLLPRTPILVGIWPAEDGRLDDERLRAAVGANYYSISLRDAVNTCLRVAGAGQERRGLEQAQAEPGRSVDLAALIQAGPPKKTAP